MVSVTSLAAIALSSKLSIMKAFHMKSRSSKIWHFYIAKFVIHATVVLLVTLVILVTLVTFITFVTFSMLFTFYIKTNLRIKYLFKQSVSQSVSHSKQSPKAGTELLGQLKNTGLFGNFYQMADPLPPSLFLGTPCSKNIR